MKSSSMIRSLPLVLSGILGAGVSIGCDGRQNGTDTTTDSASKSTPTTGADEKEKATMRLQLSLGNDTATPDSVKKELALGADPRWVSDDFDDNLLVKAVNIKTNYKISDIDIDPTNEAKMKLSILDARSSATWMPPKDPENIARICEILIKAGADVNHAGKLGRTPLVACMRYCQTPTIKVLLAAGADPNSYEVPDSTPTSPLAMAVSHQCPEAIILLLKAGAKIDRNQIIYRDMKKLGPMMEVARNDSPKLEGTPALAALEKAAADAKASGSKSTS